MRHSEAYGLGMGRGKGGGLRLEGGVIANDVLKMRKIIEFQNL